MNTSAGWFDGRASVPYSTSTLHSRLADNLRLYRRVLALLLATAWLPWLVTHWGTHFTQERGNDDHPEVSLHSEDASCFVVCMFEAYRSACKGSLHRMILDSWSRSSSLTTAYTSALVFPMTISLGFAPANCFLLAASQVIRASTCFWTLP